MVKRISTVVLCICLFVGLFPMQSFAADDYKTSAFSAYYEFIQKEVDNIGKPITDSDFYQMYSDAGRNARVKSIDAVYLLDVTNDGVEDLIIRESISYENNGAIDGIHGYLGDYTSAETEWLRIYSFVNGSLKRIGQTGSWVEKHPGTGKLGGDSYSYYEPAGYSGYMLEPYYCRGTDGKSYLMDDIPVYYTEQGYRSGVFSFDKSSGFMKTVCTLTINFAPDWVIQGVNSYYGTLLYQINYETTTKEKLEATVKKYSASNTRLVDNDYNEALRQLKPQITSVLTPSVWAVDMIDSMVSAGYVPYGLQQYFTKPITREEFCDLAAKFFEEYTGLNIASRRSFTDTTKESVQKMGSLGIVEGNGNGKFSPNNTLTREQAATIVARLAGKLGMNLSTTGVSFADASQISNWAAEAIDQVASAGIMTGTANNNFSPKKYYTREQAIVTLQKMINSMPDSLKTSIKEQKQLRIRKVAESYYKFISDLKKYGKFLNSMANDYHPMDSYELFAVDNDGKGYVIIDLHYMEPITPEKYLSKITVYSADLSTEIDPDTIDVSGYVSMEQIDGVLISREYIESILGSVEQDAIEAAKPKTVDEFYLDLAGADFRHTKIIKLEEAYIRHYTNVANENCLLVRMYFGVPVGWKVFLHKINDWRTDEITYGIENPGYLYSIGMLYSPDKAEKALNRQLDDELTQLINECPDGWTVLDVESVINN